MSPPRSAGDASAMGSSSGVSPARVSRAAAPAANSSAVPVWEAHRTSRWRVGTVGPAAAAPFGEGTGAGTRAGAGAAPVAVRENMPARTPSTHRA